MKVRGYMEGTMVQVKDRPKVMIPCWLCGSPVPVKFTKKDKPYLVCANCGVQTFIRYGKAEGLLIAKIKDYQKGS